MLDFEKIGLDPTCGTQLFTFLYDCLFDDFELETMSRNRFWHVCNLTAKTCSVGAASHLQLVNFFVHLVTVTHEELSLCDKKVCSFLPSHHKDLIS